MTISSDFINPYSDLSRKVFKPIENMLIETMPISVEFSIGLKEPNRLLRLIYRKIDDACIDPLSDEVNDFKRVMNCYSQVMCKLVKDYPLAQPSFLIFTLISGDEDSHDKKLTIQICPGRITYDLQHLGIENGMHQQADPIEWTVPLHLSQVEAVEL